MHEKIRVGNCGLFPINCRVRIALLNAPIQNKIPMQQRPIFNHLGFYAREN